MSDEYLPCPFCGHAEWHKTFGCDDTCCSGCPGDDGECDCQYTVASIVAELGRRLCPEIYVEDD